MEKYKPIELIKKLSTSEKNSYLKVTHDSVDWQIYFNQGKIYYATHSLQPFTRLERHLRRLSHEVPNLKGEIREQVRVIFEGESSNPIHKHSDYRAIAWLIKLKVINPPEAKTLITRLTKEVLSSYLMLPEIDYKVVYVQENLPRFCIFEPDILVQECLQELQEWKSLSPKIWSPDQRPYFFAQAYAKSKIAVEQKEKLSKILKGYSFRQLSAFVNQEELRLAKRLYPLIQEGTIILRPPDEPLDKLPNLNDPSLTLNLNDIPTVVQRKLTKKDLSFQTLIHAPVPEKIYKVIHVDNNNEMIETVKKYLQNENYNLFSIRDSVKALMEISQIKPDLILVEQEMKTVDGLHLTRLIRSYSSLKHIPIIILTNHITLLEKAKIRLAGATEQLNKPFTQAELIKLLSKYLS